MLISQNNHPLIMGIVNLTPDSFFSQSRKDCTNPYNGMEYKYADIIDIGCESSRPGAQPVNEKHELSRLSQGRVSKCNFLALGLPLHLRQ